VSRKVELFLGIPLWMRHAKCRDLDNEMFFVRRGSRPTDAIKLCNNCPVIKNCDDYADENQISDGVWGGKNRNKMNKDTGGPDE
jgi:WhiB family redox-sensing transcriptional regulator